MENMLQTESILIELEEAQALIGKIQKSMITSASNASSDGWVKTVMATLDMLESVQRVIGEAQSGIFKYLSMNEVVAEPAGETSVHDVCADVSLAASAPRHEAVGGTGMESPLPESGIDEALDPVKWLAKRGISVMGKREECGIDAAADSAACFLGDRFDVLRDFYSAIKRSITLNEPSFKFFVDEKPSQTISDICAFGTMLHRSAFFSSYKYVNCSKQGGRRFAQWFPARDGKVINFFNGLWLERYVYNVVRKKCVEVFGVFDERHMLPGARVCFPDGGDGELDLLLSLPDGSPLWIECKTGVWQTYVARFHGLQKKHLKIPPESAALVLLDSMKEAEKKSASELSSMVVMNIGEFHGWLENALKRKSYLAANNEHKL